MKPIYHLGALCLLIAALVYLLPEESERSPKPIAKNVPTALATSLIQTNAAIRNVGAGVPGSAQPPNKIGVSTGLVNNLVPANAPQKRAWDPQFIASLQDRSEGDPIRFELVGGQWAEGVIGFMNRKNGELLYVSGSLTAPEGGRFFFQKQTAPGHAGSFVGIVEFPASQRAFRIEPSGVNGAPELILRNLHEVLCLNLPKPDPALLATNTAEIPPLNPSTFPSNLPIPPYQNGIVVLQSLPGAKAVIYIDCQGGYTPTWGGITYEKPAMNNAQIYEVWKMVAERYQGFQINITTDLKVFQDAPPISRQRCLVTPTDKASPGNGGVSYYGSFEFGGDPDTPNWVFLIGGKACAEAIAHECGHAFGLAHDGQDIVQNGATTHVEYYGGQGDGGTGWAPVMGVGYYKQVVQWSKGEYQWANNKEDDIATISSNNNMRYRPDDTGATLATSRYLEVNSNWTASAEGVIETTGDTDAFQFTTKGGLINLTAKGVGDWSGLAIQASLCDSNDTVLVVSNPQTAINASISTNLPAGTYTFRVTGAGRNNPFTTGFSSYASLGYYSISGSVVNARLSSRFTIAENTPPGTRLGPIPAISPNGDPLTYTITAGNTGDTFTINDGVLFLAANVQVDYEALALNTQLAVQYEMFVDIVDAANPALSEYGRRVVVAVTNVNEAPAISGFTTTVLEHTTPGTAVGTVSGADPDFFTLMSYSIAGGNSNGMFAIDSYTGTVSVKGDLDASVQSVYNLAVVVSDQTGTKPFMATSTAAITVMPNVSPFHPGSISYATYELISGNLITNLVRSIQFPNDPASETQLGQMESDNNVGQNYGAVMRGYLIPPATGNYTFWIATDDNGELWLSPSTNASSMALRAYITGDGSYAGPREWTKFASQQSAPISLVGGQAYYIEARVKQGSGGDNFAVAWQCDSAGIARDVIPGKFLAPFYMNYVPHGVGFTSSLHKNAMTGAKVGTVGFTDVNPGDAHTFMIISGNSSGIFSINSTSGVVRVASGSALQNSIQTSVSLLVKVSDNGIPSRYGTAYANLSIVGSNAVTATSIAQEIWNGVSGTTLSGLTASANYPKRPDKLRTLTGFDSGSQGQGDNYGSRIRAYLTPTTSGAYTFYISSDDNSQLKLSLSTNPANATIIASVGDYSDYQQWNKFASQASTAINLVAGQKYYIEAVHKEGTGGDHIEVAWSGPGMSTPTTIASTYLTPVDLNFPPDLVGRSALIPVTATNGQIVTTLVATDSPLDSLTFSIVSGNTNGTFALNPANGQLSVVDNSFIAGRLVSSFSMVVQVQDSGYGDLYPRKSTNVTFTVGLSEAAAVVWTGGGPDEKWSQGANWRGTPPLDSSPLTFTGFNRQTNYNDQMTIAGFVTIQNGGFYFGGNPLALRSGLASRGDNVWAMDTKITKGINVTSEEGTLLLTGNVDVAGNTPALVASGTLQVDGKISGSGGLSIGGAGNTILTAANSFGGQVSVTSGKLVLSGNGAIDAAAGVDVSVGAVFDVSGLPGGFTVGALQTLSGNGSVLGNVVVKGTLSPGEPVGTLSFSNSLTLAGATVIEFNKSDAGLTNDMLVADSVTYGGSLVLTNSGTPLSLGDAIQIFSASSYGGSFASMDLPSPGPGLAWDVSSLKVDGTLRVVTLPAPHVAVGLSGGQIGLSLQTALGANYVLQKTTSLVPPVQWSDVSTNAGTGDAMVIPVLTGEGAQQFFRIVCP